MEPKSLQAFSSKEVLAKHMENCLSINGKQGIQMPKKGSKGQFQDHHRQMPVPFVSQYHLYENKQFFPIYISTGGHEELNLSLISDEEKQHYVLIKNLNSSMRNHTKHHGTKEFASI